MFLIKFRHEKKFQTKNYILFFQKQVSQEISGVSQNNITPKEVHVQYIGSAADSSLRNNGHEPL